MEQAANTLLTLRHTRPAIPNRWVRKSKLPEQYKGPLSDPEFKDWYDEQAPEFTRDWREPGSSILEEQAKFWKEKVEPVIHPPLNMGGDGEKWMYECGHKMPKEDPEVWHECAAYTERYPRTGEENEISLMGVCLKEDEYVDVVTLDEEENTCFGDCQKPCRRLPKLCRMHRLMND